MQGPESWKTKCGIRKAEDIAPLTDGGTLIMRRGPYSERLAPDPLGVNETLRTPSLAPFSIEIDAEDFEDPAGISDALGHRYQTMRVDNGERSRFAGVLAGVLSLGVGIALGYVSLTEAYLSPANSMAAGRPTHAVVHVASTFDRVGPDDAEMRVAAKPKPVRRKHVVTDDMEATPSQVADTE